MIRVGVIAASMTMRIGLREVLNNLPELEVVSSASRLEDLAADEIDVLVAVSPANLEKLENASAVLYLTDNAANLYNIPDLEVPAWGILPIDASEDELKVAISALAEGLWIGSPALVQKLFQREQSIGLNESEMTTLNLTGREIEVLQLTAQGLANKQIAVSLGISEHTIKFHLSSLYAKLGVASRTEAVRAGARRGLVVL